MKCKKLLAMLLCLGMLAGMIPAMSFGAASAATLTSSYEPGTRGVQLPAVTATNFYRHAGFVVCYTDGFDANTDFAANASLYTPSWYSMNFYTEKNRSATNEWGTEIAVNEYGYVISKTVSGEGGNMAIPAGGYVLSAVNGDGVTPATELASKVNVGDYIRVSGNNYYVYKTTDDSKFTDASSAFKIKKTQVLEIVDGGSTPTKATQWTSTVLCKGTGTGQDGIENHVGYLVKFGGKEITVPDGYFALVLSGSPLKDTGVPAYNAACLFEEFAAPGAVVNIGANDIFFRYDVAAAKRAARLMSGTTDSTVTTAYDYSANTMYTDAVNHYEIVDTARMKTLNDNMAAIADAVQSMTTIEEMEPYMATLYQNYAEMRTLELETKSVEMRAIWWRPLANDRVQRTKAELDAMVEESVSAFKAQGYNMVFLESFYNSCTIFPVDSSAGYKGLSFQQNPYLVPTSQGGLNANLTEPYDMLQSWIDVCAKYDIECHVWWQVLYIGYERHNVSNSDDLSEYGIGPVIEADIKQNGSSSKYYNWLNIGHDGSYVSGSVAKNLTRYWLNPGNEDVRQFLLNLLSYVCSNYDTDSFQLDYFRHPNDGIREFGYDSDTVAAFKAAYPAYKNTDLTASSNWKNADWVQFRANYITTLIGEMRTMLDEDFPAVSLTTSPQPDPASALKSDLQDVSAWLGNGYIDTIFPMAYGYHIPGYVTPTLVEQNESRFVCTGLSVSYDDEELETEWVRQIRNAGADGVATFGETIPHYSESIWSNSAVTPTGNAARAARIYLNETVKERVVRMKSKGDINASKQTQINNAIDAADKAIRLYGIESSQALTAIQALNSLGLSGNPKTVMANDVAYLIKIRNNSHDAAKEDRQLKVENEVSTNSTLSIGGVNVANDSDTAFVYTASTKTLFVKATARFWPTLSGSMTAPVTVVADDGVETLEFDNVTMTAENAALVENSGLAIELTGKNVIDGSIGSVSYFGTGSLYNGATLVRMQGDVTGDNKLNTSDVKELIRHNVKVITLSDTKLALCDANGDEAINTIDTRMFLKATLEA